MTSEKVEVGMQLGLVGAGRMGANLARRLQHAGHEPVVTDRDPEVLAPLEAEGIGVAGDLAGLAKALETPRAVWVMVPAAAVGSVVDNLAEVLDAGDVVIDGGNSHWREDPPRSQQLAGSGITYLDVGTSGGVHGLERGYCLMIGGPATEVERLRPIWDALAPGVDEAPRTPGKAGAPSPGEQGWLHCGPSGAGHFVKMVHNGIEYGIMAAYAEGFNLLRRAGSGANENDGVPDNWPDGVEYDFDLAGVAELWRRGSVIGSWLLDLTATALASDPGLDELTGWVSDSGEGRWAVHAALDVAAPVPVLSAALHQRFASRDGDDYARKVLSAMREQFGGHTEPAEPTEPTGGGE